MSVLTRMNECLTRATIAMPDTYEFNVSFVAAIENYPLIYNSQLRDYTNRSKVDSAWQAISTQFDYSIDQCKARWKNIRDSYLRHLRSQYRPAAKPKKPYYLEPHMLFLKPFTRGGKRILAGLPPSPSEEDLDNSDYLSCLEQDMRVEENDVQVVSDQDGTPENTAPGEVPDEADKPDERQEDGIEPRRKRVKVDLLPNPRSRYSGVEEEMYLFFKSLLPDMRHFSRRQIFSIKKKVLDLIEEVGATEE